LFCRTGSPPEEQNNSLLPNALEHLGRPSSCNFWIRALPRVAFALVELLPFFCIRVSGFPVCHPGDVITGPAVQAVIDLSRAPICRLHTWFYSIFQITPCLSWKNDFVTDECENFFLHVQVPTCSYTFLEQYRPFRIPTTLPDGPIRFKIRTDIKRYERHPSWVMSLFIDQDDHTPYPSHTNIFSDSIPPPSPTSSSAGTRTDVPPSSPQSYHLKCEPYYLHSDLASHLSSTVQPSESTDVNFKSSDNIYFSLHRRNLETHADAFPGPDMPVNQGEVIDLTESHDILAIVFDFMYPRKQADIEKMEFETVIQVAEAVEKYQVYPAMKVCEMRLK